MANITIRKHIDAPHELVFELASDLTRVPEHVQSIEKLELLTPEPIGVGTKFRETRKVFGKETSEELEITSFEPNQGYTIECESCGAHYRAEYKFVGDISGTHLQLSMDSRAVSLMAKLMSPFSFLMVGSMKKMVEADLDDIKKVAEERAKELTHQS